jgi:hypothetical protein
MDNIPGDITAESKVIQEERDRTMYDLENYQENDTEAEEEQNHEQVVANLNILKDQYQVRNENYQGKNETFFTGLP